MLKSTKQALVSGLVISQLSMGCALPTVAATGDVTIAGNTVFTNRAASGESSIQTRTDEIQGNLDNALVATPDHSPAAVKVVKFKGNYIVTLGSYKIVTVDSTNAKLAKTTVPVLANRWANAIRKQLEDQAAIDEYVAQLSGEPDAATEPVVAPPRESAGYHPSTVVETPMQAPPQKSMPLQARLVYAPAGLTIPITLSTSVSSQAAKAGDLVVANVSQNVSINGEALIPAGSAVMGQVTDAEPGRMLNRSGALGIKFDRIRTPDGVETPISAHLVGNIGKYAPKGDEGGQTVRGETLKNKLGSVAIRGLVGAGTGAALGTAVGAIAGGSHGAGRGAWSGTAVGAGAGVAQSLLLRKAADVILPSGTAMQLQLDAPMAISTKYVQLTE